MSFHRLVYRFLIFFYGLTLNFASLFVHKARLWRNGRKNWREKLAKGLKIAHDNSQPVLWLHAASLGEYEQGKMLLQKYKNEQNYFIVLSFFSPSGYEIINQQNEKNRAQGENLIDFVCYLPLDTADNAQYFLATVRPALIFWVKYEFWYNYLHTAAQSQIPIYLLAVIFSPQHLIFSRWARLTWQTMDFFSLIFTQNQNSKNEVADFLAKKTKAKDIFYTNHNFLPKIIPAGDTRVDSIVQTAQNWQTLPIVEWFISAKEDFINKKNSCNKIFIVGSSHGEDLPFLAQIFPFLWAENWKIIIVPHEINPKAIQQLQIFLQKLNAVPILYSDCENRIPHNENREPHNEARTPPPTLVIDKIGLLKHVYKYGNFAYIGGGFSGGLHNVLEAAVFGLPTAFGGALYKFTELKELLKLQTAFHLSQNKPLIIQNWLKFIQNTQLAAQNAEIKTNLNLFFNQHQGATEQIYQHIQNEKK